MRLKLLKSQLDAKKKSFADHSCQIGKLRIFIPK